MNSMKKVFILLIVILSGLITGIVADYFEINRILKYALIIFAVISSHRLLDHINNKCPK